MCRNVSKKYKKYLKDKSKMSYIMNDIKKIQSLPFADEIDIALSLWKKKYCDESAFLAQFKDSYLIEHKKNWLRGYLAPGVPCSNNGHERFNMFIKKSLSSYQKMSSRKFLDGMVDWVRQISSDHCKEWPKNPLDATGANEYHRSRIREIHRQSQILIKEKLYRFHLISQNELACISNELDQNGLQELLTYYTNAEVVDFKEFILSRKSVYLITPSDGYFNNDCSCHSFMEYGACKHIIAFLIFEKKYEIPSIYSITTIGDKKKSWQTKEIAHVTFT
jgi:hypothetical protein